MQQIPFQHSSTSLPTIITYYTSVYHYVAVCHRRSSDSFLSGGCLKFASVLLIIVNYKSLVMLEAPWSREKAANGKNGGVELEERCERCKDNAEEG